MYRYLTWPFPLAQDKRGSLSPALLGSYFIWNFFDNILQQKEWFSSYVFEDIAEKLLIEDTLLKERFESKKRVDSIFAHNAGAQLYFIYKHSSYYEKTHNLYPVGRLMKKVSLPIE